MGQENVSHQPRLALDAGLPGLLAPAGRTASTRLTSTNHTHESRVRILPGAPGMWLYGASNARIRNLWQDHGVRDQFVALEYS